MSTTTTRRRISSKDNFNSNAMHGANADVFSALCASYEVKAYGSGQPLYELVMAYGTITPLNNLDTALHSFEELQAALKEGDAAFAYSNEYDRYTLAMKTGRGIVFASLLHDENGTPRVDEPLLLCWVKAGKDFVWEDNVIIKKGDQFVKVLPESYVSKLTKAAN